MAVPRLPGHGTTWQDLNTTTWADWYGTAEKEFRTLTATCDQVFIAALSVGSSLAFRLAELYGEQVAGLSVVNPIVSQQDIRLASSLVALGVADVSRSDQRHRQARPG